MSEINNYNDNGIEMGGRSENNTENMEFKKDVKTPQSNEEVTINNGKFFNIHEYEEKCLELIIEYKRLSSDESFYLMEYSAEIYNNLDDLLGLLSNDNLQLETSKDNNLSVKLSDQESNIDLEKLKEIFVFIKDFVKNKEMIIFSNKFGDKDDDNLLGKFKKFKNNVEQKIGQIKILNEIEENVIQDIKEVCQVSLSTEKPRHIVTDTETKEIDKDMKSGIFPIYENRPSLLQKIKTFFTETIPNFFKKTFGGTESIARTNKNNSREVFTGAADVINIEQNNINKQKNQKIENETKVNELGASQNNGRNLP